MNNFFRTILQILRHTFLIYKKISILILSLLLFPLFWQLFWLTSTLFFPLPENITSDFSQTFYYRDNSIAWIDMNRNDQYRIATSLKDLSPYIKKGVVEYEDKLFYMHPGVNPLSIIRALFLNMKAGTIVSGGSTITMQLARLAEPKERTIPSKLMEMCRAFQFEARYSKKKILELYCNSIPMGGNIQGVGTASFFYFNKKPSQLTFSESSLLLGLSNSPYYNRPDLFPDHAKKRRDAIARRISPVFSIKKPDLDRILQTPVSVTRHKFNIDIIPLIEKFSHAHFASHRTLSIDKKLQNLSLTILRGEMFKEKSTNGALIIVDNQTMEVLAYIGAPYYTSIYPAAKYNAAHIKRSPGSTLKPFIYAKALDRGLISEKSTLYDIPLDFNGYQPENFMNTYYGPISADKALIQSLNIPAVYLEQALGKNNLTNLLLENGYANLLSRPQSNDLSVALGSYNMSLEEMVELYTALARKGCLSRLKFTRLSTPANSGRKIISESASYIISTILSEVKRPDLPASWEFSPDKPRVAYKTGTSYGFIDAWAIGYTPRYTIGVWIGNLDNRYIRPLIGLRSAAPILFLVMNELERKNDLWFSQPQDVAEREVCSQSGMIPGPFCTHTKKELYIPGISPYTTCTIHKRVLLDPDSGKVVPINKMQPDRIYEEAIIEKWPEKVAAYLSQSGQFNGFGFEGNYEDIVTTDTLTILSPSSSITYTVHTALPLESQRIACYAYPWPDSEELFWYHDGVLLGQIKAGETLFFTPNSPFSEISVIDKKGRTSSITLHTEFVEPGEKE